MACTGPAVHWQVDRETARRPREGGCFLQLLLQAVPGPRAPAWPQPCCRFCLPTGCRGQHGPAMRRHPRGPGWQEVSTKMKVAPSCPTLYDPMGYTVHGIPQARILEWAAFPFSRGSSRPRDRTQVSCIGGGFFTT